MQDYSFLRLPIAILHSISINIHLLTTSQPSEIQLSPPSTIRTGQCFHVLDLNQQDFHFSYEPHPLISATFCTLSHNFQQLSFYFSSRLFIVIFGKFSARQADTPLVKENSQFFIEKKLSGWRVIKYTNIRQYLKESSLL